ncbi:hypothetical protein GCM10023186_00600 [Hymenobacter koreensis]|uniref:Uncharacterized protein n=1 Tax=Hymenobacter koreensis TaxID=1084523 RepID=A0ABP8ITK7_9BACT
MAFKFALAGAYVPELPQAAEEPPNAVTLGVAGGTCAGAVCGLGAAAGQSGHKMSLVVARAANNKELLTIGDSIYRYAATSLWLLQEQPPVPNP